MNSKKKMIIAISAFAMVVLAAVVAVVAVLAAQQVTVKSQINITYTAGANVIGKVEASYVMQDTSKTGDLGNTPFDGNEVTDANKNLTNVGTLSFVKDTNEYIELTFEFTNESTVANYTATLTFTGTPTNVTISHKLNGAASFTEVDSFAELPTITVNKNNGTANGTGTYVLKVALTNDLQDASFNGTLQWQLVASK